MWSGAWKLFAAKPLPSVTPLQPWKKLIVVFWRFAKGATKRPRRPIAARVRRTAWQRNGPTYCPLCPPLTPPVRPHARVDKYATVIVDQNHYSVPDVYVGKMVFVKVYSGRLQCFFEGSKVAEHPRLTGSHEWSMELAHYLATLKKKPGALAGSQALQLSKQKTAKYLPHLL